MKYKAMVEMIYTGEVEVELPATASDHEITTAFFNRAVANQHKMESEFTINWSEMERVSQ